MDKDTLQSLVDRQQITESSHKYVIGLDSLDRDMLLSVGHPTGAVDFDGLFNGHWPAFVDWVIPTHQALLYHNHRVTNLLIEVTGDTARSRSNVTATLLIKQPSGEIDERRIQARYLDKWVRAGGGWLIAERKLVRDMRRTTRISSDEFKSRYIVEKH
jgi:hypothetical protein